MLKRFASNAANGLVNNFTIANIITILGLIIDLWNNYLIYSGTRGLLPLLLLWTVPLTDLADGFFARRRKAETWVGEALDPIRDKVYACSKFYFMIGGFLVIYSLYPILIPLTIIVYVILAFLEILLFLAGIYGMARGYKIKANRWGKHKMGSECALLCLIWGPIFLVSPWGLSIDNQFILILLTILPLIPIYLALKSLDGHIAAFKEGRK